MKIATYGVKSYTSQLKRIEDGFAWLGHTLNNNISDIIYVNDTTYYEVGVKHKNEHGGKLILNILDRPFHVKDIEKWDEKIKEYLSQADFVTTTSKTTQKQIKDYVGFDSYVIYQPIKDVFFNGSTRTKFSMTVARNKDTNKRFILTAKSVKAMAASCGKEPNEILDVFGFEDAGFGKFHGIVSDLNLNAEYNRHQVCWITSFNEGLCLPMIESMVCGCVPIVCNDMTTAQEFCPEEFQSNPEVNDLMKKAIDIHENFKKYQEIALRFGEIYKKQFSKISIANNILNLLK